MLVRRKKKVSGCPQDTTELISSIVHLAERKCVITPLYLINPRRACAERVTVVVSCVCLSVCMYVCMSLLLLIMQIKFSDDLRYRYNKCTQLFNDKFMHEYHY